MATGAFGAHVSTFQHIVVVVSEVRRRSPETLIVTTLAVLHQTTGVDVSVTAHAFLGKAQIGHFTNQVGKTGQRKGLG
jgi:hypothetical protein